MVFVGILIRILLVSRIYPERRSRLGALGPALSVFGRGLWTPPWSGRFLR